MLSTTAASRSSCVRIVYVHRQIECRVTGGGLGLFRTGVALEHEVDIGNTDRVKVDFALACPLLGTRCFEISVDGPCSMRWDRICGRPYGD